MVKPSKLASARPLKHCSIIMLFANSIDEFGALKHGSSVETNAATFLVQPVLQLYTPKCAQAIIKIDFVAMYLPCFDFKIVYWCLYSDKKSCVDFVSAYFECIRHPNIM